MKKIISCLLLVFLVQLLQAAPVDSVVAAKIAQNFYKQNNAVSVVNGVPLREAKPDKNFRNITSATTFRNFYIFNADDGGFVIVAADDRAVPVLGYSDNGFINVDNLPANFQWWLGEYEREIDYAIENDIAADEETSEEWAALRAGQTLPLRDAKGVTPLLQTKWDQGPYPYYNSLCPHDVYGNYAVTGCVATAMAQIMKYWEYPIVGKGSHFYWNNNFGAQYANFETNYFWNNMPNKVDASSSFMQIYSVAKLMRVCGVSVDMGYDISANGGSGALPRNVPNAFSNYFDYSSNVKILAQSNYSYSAWQSILKNELNNGRPVFYSGSGSDGGHAFVCDGVSNSNNFHFNWGWGGSSDGYFAINALNPGGADFSTDQVAVIGIEPAHPVAKPAYDLVMNSTLSTDASTYNFGENVIVTRSIKNSGTAAFNGYIRVMLCDMNDNIVGYRLNYVTIPANGTNTSSVTFNGYAPLVPGNYYIIVCSMTDKDDISTLRLVRDDNSHQNFATIEIQSTGSIETYSDLSNYSTLDSGKSATVSVKLKNNTSSSFTGTAALVIADLSGNIEQYIGQKSISNLSAYNTYTVSCTSTILVSSGEHLLMLIYKPSGSSGWYYAGSSYYYNPVRINVRGTPSPDKYEADNNVSTAYNLGSVNIDYEKFDIDANFHNSTDKDYYKISLPAGYAYEINAIIWGSDNIGSDFFSVDAVFATSPDGSSWSINHDDTISSLIVYGDSVLYLRVLPYNSGNVGTYRLNIEVLRAILPDKYEDNDSEMSAYTLATVNSASQTITADANFHIESDEDFYKIILPAGYDYKVNAIIYTSYNSTTYTADAKFATSTDGVSWSNNYGTQMPEMSLSGSAVLFFRVLPYTIGELGTYQLNIQVQRTQTTPSINPDQYENNNSVATAYTLTTVNNNSAQVSADANFHIEGDADFYKIILPVGYDYKVNAILNTSYNSATYTAAAKFATSLDGATWSNNYITQMPEMSLSGSAVIFFRVLPYTNDELGTYQLNIQVQRTQSTPSINPDQYENNNSVATAYTLTTVNTNSAQVSAEANFHVSNDVDFYKVVLPAGYDYTVNATLYSKANSTSYTAQASFATSTNGGSAWAGDYVTQMPEMTVSNGGTVYFRVALNSDDLGTYKLAISVQRKSLVGIGETDNLAEWTVYPIPATDVLNISAPDGVESYTLDLLAMDGKLIRKYYGEVSSINVSDLPSGIYFVRIVAGKSVVIRKWVK